jgi:hypothetical protein
MLNQAVQAANLVQSTRCALHTFAENASCMPCTSLQFSHTPCHIQSVLSDAAAVLLLYPGLSLQQEDDVTIIASRLSFVPALNGNSIGSATALTPTVTGTTASASATGIVTQAGAADFFSFTAAAGTATVSAQVGDAVWRLFLAAGSICMPRLLQTTQLLVLGASFFHSCVSVHASNDVHASNSPVQQCHVPAFATAKLFHTLHCLAPCRC